MGFEEECLSGIGWVVRGNGTYKFYIFNDETPENLIIEISPDVLIKGGDYQGKYIAGQDHMEKIKKTVELVELVPEKSTSKLIDIIKKS